MKMKNLKEIIRRAKGLKATSIKVTEGTAIFTGKSNHTEVRIEVESKGNTEELDLIRLERAVKEIPDFAEVDLNYGTLKIEDRKIELEVMEEVKRDLKQVTGIIGATILGKDLLEALKNTSKWASKELSINALTGIFIEIKDGQLKATAVDGYKIISKVIPVQNEGAEEVEFIMPIEVVTCLKSILGKKDIVKLRYNKEQGALNVRVGSGISIISNDSVLGERFFNYKPVFEKKDYSVAIKKEDLQRATSIPFDLAAPNPTIQISKENGKIKVGDLLTCCECEEFKEREYNKKDLEYAISCFENNSLIFIELQKSECTAVILRGSNLSVLSLPMRKRKQD